MATRIKFLGIATFEIETSKGLHILIDPFLEGNPACPIKVNDLERVDLLLVTHAAADHLGQASEVAKKFGCTVICGNDTKVYLMKEGVPESQIKNTVWGLVVKGPVEVRSVESRHWSMVKAPDGSYLSGPPMGFIIYADPGVRIYHSGDTALFSDLKLIGELYKPNIGLLNISLPKRFGTETLKRPDLIVGEMTPYEAALAAQWLGLEYAIACHFDETNPEESEDARAFAQLLNGMASDKKPYVKPVLLKSGEVFTYNPSIE